MMIDFILLIHVYGSYVYGHSGNMDALLNPKHSNCIALAFVLLLVVTGTFIW